MAFEAGSFIRAGDVDEVIQIGKAAVSFTNVSSYTQNVAFPRAFPGIPNVHLNIDSGAGITARWFCRAIALSATGFTIFLFPSTSGSTATWTDVPIAWTAIYRP